MGSKIVTYLLLLLLLAGSVITQPRSQCIGICDQPLLVRVYKTASQSIPAATATNIIFEGETVDEGNFHNTTVNPDRITVPVAGTYLGSCIILWASSSSGIRRTHVRLNDVSTILEVTADATAELTSPLYTGTFMARLNAGDYLTCTATQNTGGNLNVLGPGEYDTTSFWLMRIK